MDPQSMSLDHIDEAFRLSVVATIQHASGAIVEAGGNLGTQPGDPAAGDGGELVS